MKIKLAILEKDQNYLNRVVNALNMKYAENFEIYSFTDLEVAMSNLDPARIEVLLAGESFDINVKDLPKRCGFAYLVESMDLDSYKDQQAIGKYQRIDLVYKQILSIYSENAGNSARSVRDGDMAKIIAFQSVSGGCGASTMAAACALRFASLGRKTLYLSFEKIGSTDLFFKGEGQFDMSDVIFALKSRKTNLALKLESCVKQDPRGPYFYSGTKVALDMMEIKAEDVKRLLSELKISGSYDAIILDLDFSLTKEDLSIMNSVHHLVWVNDGSEIANYKFERAYNAVKLMEEGSDLDVSRHVCSVYCKFSNKASKVLTGVEVKNLGGAPRYEHATQTMVLEQLSKMGMFDELLQ